MNVTEETRVIDDAVKKIQEHLDKEARNRSLPVLKPRDLCPIQKARLVSDLASVLEGEKKTGSVFGLRMPSALRNLFGSIRRLV